MKLGLKHIIYIMASIILASCAMEPNKASSDILIDDVASENTDVPVLDESISSKSLPINEKLQDFYDLIALQKQHPEFTDEVLQQLRNYTSDSISNYNNDDAVVIKNIRQIGPTMRINDSIQKTKYIYDKVLDRQKVTDSIYALIITKTMTLDGKPLVSKKIRFTKN